MSTQQQTDRYITLLALAATSDTTEDWLRHTYAAEQIRVANPDVDTADSYRRVQLLAAQYDAEGRS